MGPMAEIYQAMANGIVALRRLALTSPAVAAVADGITDSPLVVRAMSHPDGLASGLACLDSAELQQLLGAMRKGTYEAEAEMHCAEGKLLRAATGRH